jgi:ATP-dependent exoDNAse (exonuclease V) alpha subunit
VTCFTNPAKDEKDVDTVHNADTFKVISFQDDHVVLCDDLDKSTVKIPSAEYRRRFDYAYAFTADKIQGSEIVGKYIIHNIKNMKRRQAYVSLSRGRKSSDIIYENSSDFQFPKDPMNSYETELFIPAKPSRKYIYRIYSPVQWASCEGAFEKARQNCRAFF